MTDVVKKKSKGPSPTQRTLALCKKTGWTVQVVEHWNSFAKIRQDLFGVIDAVALDGVSIIGIQATSGDNVSKRILKIREEPRAILWLKCGGRLFVHGWRKLVKSGRWECREIELLLDSKTGEITEYVHD